MPDRKRRVKETGLLTLAAFTVFAAAPADAGELLCPSRARVRCGLPLYDYQPRPVSLPIPGETFSAVVLEARSIETAVAPGPDGRPTVVQVKTFALADPGLTLGHCTIRNVSVQITEDGHWSINLEARQHPFVGPHAAALPAVRFKRNRFFVTARALGNYTLPERAVAVKVAKPEFYRLYVPPFWVERSDTETIMTGGRLSPEQQRYFATIDRFEIVLRYE